MRFYTRQHKFYCGIDLHARTMYVCILNQEREILLHRNIPSDKEGFLKIIAPYREDLAVAVECIFTWYWLADLCDSEGIPFVLGHALYMKAIHGGKAKNDKIDSNKIALLLRGGMIPQAYVYPARMRATRDLLRRRMHLMRKRAELLAHIQNTNSQYNLPEIGVKIAYKANRVGIAERFPQPAVARSISVDIALIDHYDQLLGDLELYIVRTAKEHDSNTFHRLRSIHGVGKILSLVLLYEIHDIDRFPTVQDFVSYLPPGQVRQRVCRKALRHRRKEDRQCAFKVGLLRSRRSFLRGNPSAQNFLKKLAQKRGKGKALSILAHRLGRAVFYMMKRKPLSTRRNFWPNPLEQTDQPDA
ncbi:MAG: IS110 family transposase (plasmid) [Candidatus Manganitrophus sp.]|nr:IS110 family transposase [Candidatus Manganitrophus sp.]